MIEVGGWVARYSEPGINGIIFNEGCFDKSDRIVPITKTISDYSADAVIGCAKLKPLVEGLWAECFVRDDMLNYIPKSFQFYAARPKMHTDPLDRIHYDEIIVRDLAFGIEPIKTSIIFCIRWIEDEKENETMKEWQERIMEQDKKKMEHDAEVIKALNMYENGKKCSEIGTALGKPESTIRNWLRPYFKPMNSKDVPGWALHKDSNVTVANDPVNHPSHYTDGKIEVIDFIEDKKLGFHLGNAVKYISRAGKKDPSKKVEDLKKAKWYLDRYIDMLTRTEPITYRDYIPPRFDDGDADGDNLTMLLGKTILDEHMINKCAQASSKPEDYDGVTAQC